MGHGGVRVFHRSGIKGTNRTQPCWPQVDRYQQRKCGSSTLPLASVCTEVRHKGVEPIFSATPPLETLRVLLCVACQDDVFRVEDPFLISIADVSRAHFYADAVRDVYVRLPDEDPKAKQPGVCGKLRKTMHGSLDAAQRWGEHYAQCGNPSVFQEFAMCTERVCLLSWSFCRSLLFFLHRHDDVTPSWFRVLKSYVLRVLDGNKIKLWCSPSLSVFTVFVVSSLFTPSLLV